MTDQNRSQPVMSGLHYVNQSRSLIRVHCKSGADQTVMPRLRTIQQINELSSTAVKTEPRPRLVNDCKTGAQVCKPQNEGSQENHALQAHRFKERERHKEINATIDAMAAIVPSVGGARKETRVVMLQRIIAYMYFMEYKTKQICSRMNILPDRYLHTNVMDNIGIDEGLLENIPNLYSKDSEFNPLEYLYSFLSNIDGFPRGLTGRDIEAKAVQVGISEKHKKSSVNLEMLKPIQLFTPPKLVGVKPRPPSGNLLTVCRKLPFNENADSRPPPAKRAKGYELTSEPFNPIREPTETPTYGLIEREGVLPLGDVHCVPELPALHIEVGHDNSSGDPRTITKRIQLPAHPMQTSDLSTSSPSTSSESSQGDSLFVPLDLQFFSPSLVGQCQGDPALSYTSCRDPTLSSTSYCDPMLTSLSLRCLESLSSDCSPVDFADSNDFEQQVPELDSLPDLCNDEEFQPGGISKSPSMKLEELDYMEGLMF